MMALTPIIFCHIVQYYRHSNAYYNIYMHRLYHNILGVAALLLSNSKFYRSYSNYITVMYRFVSSVMIHNQDVAL